MISLERHRQRNCVLRVIRAYFQDQGFLELEAPCLVQGTCPDPFIESFRVGDRYLTTSTEYHIKRLLAAGASRVYTLQSNFRLGDLSRVHNPEFTMLEWGRVEATLRQIEVDLETIVAQAAQALHGRMHAPSQGGSIDLSPPFERIGVTEALSRYTGATIKHFEPVEMLAELRRVGVDVPSGCDDDATALFSLLVDHLQGMLGHDRPVWLVDWPAYLGSSVATTERGVVERSELFIRGLEVSDGFPFVSDAPAQRQRFEQANQRRRENGRDAVELDEQYLAELPKLPAGAGMAVGVDRLMMALLGATAVADVRAFPWDVA